METQLIYDSHPTVKAHTCTSCKSHPRPRYHLRRRHTQLTPDLAAALFAHTHHSHRRDGWSDFTGFFTKTLPGAFDEVGEAFQTGFNDIAFGLSYFDNWMKDTFASDCLDILTAVGDLSLSILKFAGGFATAIVDVVAYPVMEVLGPMLAPVLEKIPGEEEFAQKIGVDVPILSNFFDHLPKPKQQQPPPPAQAPATPECL